MSDDTRELIRLLRQATLHEARETVRFQNRTLFQKIWPPVLMAAVCLSLGVLLAVGLTMVGQAL